MLCISTSFWVLRALKSWSNYFFQPFSTFFVHFKPLSVISHLKSTKMNKKGWKWLKKRSLTSFLKAGWNTQQLLNWPQRYWIFTHLEYKSLELEIRTCKMFISEVKKKLTCCPWINILNWFKWDFRRVTLTVTNVQNTKH